MTGSEGSALSGRVAVVTGGHDGVGYYIAEALLGEGMRVALLARRREVLQQAARKLAGDVLPVVCDIRDPDSVRAAFASVDEGLGGVSVLVNNAAIISIYRIAEASDEELHATVQTNLLGVMYCIGKQPRACVPPGWVTLSTLLQRRCCGRFRICLAIRPPRRRWRP